MIPTCSRLLLLVSLGVIGLSGCGHLKTDPSWTRYELDLNAGRHFYVAPEGNDVWSGTRPEPNGTDGPFATVGRARDAIRALSETQRAEPITIFLRGGVYPIADTIVFSPEDSGTETCPVTLAAWPGECPVLDGSVILKSPWTQAPDSPVWSCSVADGVEIEDLFVNGIRQRRARMPNDGLFRARDIDGKHQSHNTFTFPPKDPLRNWPDLASAVCIMRSYQWSEDQRAIASIDEKTRTITLARNTSYPIVPSKGDHWGRYWIENVRAALDQPGEWCLDRASRTLSWWPTDGADPNRTEIRYPKTSVLIDLAGDPKEGRFVEYFNIVGLTFRHAHRYALLKIRPISNVLSYTHRQGAALSAQGARHCLIAGNTFVDLCGSGIVLRDSSRDNRIIDNELNRFGSTGISITGRSLAFDKAGQPQGPPVSGNNLVADNRIHHGGLVRNKGVAIALSRTEDNRIAHNLIHAMPYIGISTGGAFIDDWTKGYANRRAYPLQGNVIEDNHIHHVLQDMRDGAAIYNFGLGGTRPNIIRRNLIHHVGDDGVAVGLYLDDESDNFHLYGNIVHTSAVGLLLHGCTHSTIENNIFVGCKVADLWVHPESYNVAPLGNVLRRNIWYCGQGELFRLVGQNKPDNRFWGKEPFAEFNHNLYWRGDESIELGFGRGFDSDSIVVDPQFADPAGGDFGVSQDSPARRIGFKPIDLTRAGPRGQ